MKKKILIIVVYVLAVIGIISIFTMASYYYQLDPFYRDCMSLAPGMSKAEVNQHISKYLADSKYSIGKRIPNNGKYGWGGSLEYDDSLSIHGNRNDDDSRHCDLLFSNGKLVAVEPNF